MRLFVGIDIPLEIATRLEAAQTIDGPGIRKVRPADFHLTLHFLGQMDADAVAVVLERVTASRPHIHVQGLGQFRMRDGRRIFWAGIEPNDGLLALKKAVADPLADIGYVPERRPYRPHITLARIARGAAGRQFEAFVAAGHDRDLGEFDAAAFQLYDTAPPEAADRYRRLRSYPLSD